MNFILIILIEILFFLAIAPGVLLVLYFYWRDKYEREPFGRLIVAFLLGPLSVVLAIILEVLLGALSLFSGNNISLFSKFILAFFIVGFSEEISKFLPFFFYGYRSRHFNEPFDGVVYGTIVSLGFATIENLMYVLPGGFGVGIGRMIFSVPGHAMFGGIMGYFAGRAKFMRGANRRGKTLMLGLLVAILIHGFYDFLLFWNTPFSLVLFVVFFIIGWIIFFILMKRSLRLSPFRK